MASGPPWSCRNSVTSRPFTRNRSRSYATWRKMLWMDGGVTPVATLIRVTGCARGRGAAPLASAAPVSRERNARRRITRSPVRGVPPAPGGPAPAARPPPGPGVEGRGGPSSPEGGLGAPGLEPALQPLDQVRDDDAEHRQHDDRHEQLRRSKRVPVEHDHVAVARQRGEHLGDHDADEPPTERQPRPGHEERHPGVEDDAPEDLPPAAAERPRGLDERRG